MSMFLKHGKWRVLNTERLKPAEQSTGGAKNLATTNKGVIRF